MRVQCTQVSKSNVLVMSSFIGRVREQDKRGLVEAKTTSNLEDK